MSWLEDQLKNAGKVVGERLEGATEGAIASLLGGGSSKGGGVTVGETATGTPLVQQTPTGMGQQQQYAGDTMPAWVKPAAVGVGVMLAAALAWRLATGSK